MDPGVHFDFTKHATLSANHKEPSVSFRGEPNTRRYPENYELAGLGCASANGP